MYLVIINFIHVKEGKIHFTNIIVIVNNVILLVYVMNSQTRRNKVVFRTFCNYRVFRSDCASQDRCLLPGADSKYLSLYDSNITFVLYYHCNL